MDLSKVEEFYEFRPGRHDFYRCVKCQTLFTQQHERERMMELTDNEALFIHCTSLRYQPTLPYWWEWLLPKTQLYAMKVLLARAVAPWAKKYGLTGIRIAALRLAGNKTTR